MSITPDLQQRHFVYVLGPNQDSRLASVAPGQVLTEVLLQTEDDAPFVLTHRAVRCSYNLTSTTQAPLIGLKTKWTGPTRDYKIQGFQRESLAMANYGQQGNPKPIVPGIMYPQRSVLLLDLINAGVSTIPNLTFFFGGFKLYPKGTVPAYTYPPRFESQTFAYPIKISQLAPVEVRPDNIFTCKQDADFILRGGQCFPKSLQPFGLFVTEVSIRLKDHAKNPYSSDFVPFDVLFGTALSSVPVDANFFVPIGLGPGSPGLLYPEIYVPKNMQLLYDLQRNDDISSGFNGPVDLQFNFIGGKAFVR